MALARYELDPDRSQVSIDGSSSIHPIRATATGLHGWIELDIGPGGIASGSAARGEVRIEVDRLRSGNPLVDAETRRRIDARRHPEIVGVITGSSRPAGDRLALDGTISFRGETEPVAGDLFVALHDGQLRLAGEQVMDVRTWGLQPPRVGLVKVHPEITVRLQAVATSG
jgi:polyisoprenoid-binding protein YceI